MKSIAIILFVLIYQLSSGQTKPDDSLNKEMPPIPIAPPPAETYTGESTKVSNNVYSVTEKMPAFVDGGETGFLRFISANFHYPRKERRKNIQGTVFVEFIIRPNGDVTDVKILKGVSEGLDKEAVRVIASSPKWEPGMQSGKYVSVYYRVPIYCHLY